MNRLMTHESPVLTGVLDSRGRKTPLAPVLEWDSKSLLVVCPYCQRYHRHGLGGHPLTGQTRVAHCDQGLHLASYQLFYPFEEQAGAQLSYRIHKPRRLFVTVGIPLLNEDENEGEGDEGVTDEDVEGDKGEGAGEEPVGADGEHWDPGTESAESNSDRPQNLENQLRQLEIDEAKSQEPFSPDRIIAELMQDPESL
jgi:hypothetical protein